jgi:hypothetical protein
MSNDYDIQKIQEENLDNQMKIIREYIDNGVDIDAKNEMNERLLDVLINNRNWESGLLVLENMKDLDYVNDTYNDHILSVLLCSATNDNIHIVSKLMKTILLFQKNKNMNV